MIDSPALLKDLKKLLTQLERDLRDQLDREPALAASLQQEWQQARDAKRTAATLYDWQAEALTQSAVHWILACVFLRFLEDNDFLDEPLLFAPDAARQALVRDRYQAYFTANPVHSDRDYLLQAFATAAALPGLAGLFDPRHNPLHRLPISGDGAISLLGFFRRIAPDSGALIHDFTDPERRTRFLGDLYQDLSESAKKRYALLQTPIFVEEFILDRTLTPAIETFGFREVRMIDPACGSGHFLLGGFERLFRLWATAEPGRNRADLAQRALDGVYGVDLNPFAVEIARFRLLIAALTGAEIVRLGSAPDFRVHVVTGDSLLHGKQFGLTQTLGMFESASDYASTGLTHAYAVEDLDALRAVLGQQYHAVVGNPPYIVPNDAALNEKYRGIYVSCHRKYSLGAPFTERLFKLAVSAEPGSAREGGFVGLITANSFMKREFGRKLVEEVLPHMDLTHVVDTSGAYIPGHGTPTVILLGRNRKRDVALVRAVLSISGEPSEPADASRGLVWRSIVELIDTPGARNPFVSVSDLEKAALSVFPWSLTGGDAPEAKNSIESAATSRLDAIAELYGGTGRTSADDVFTADVQYFGRVGLEQEFIQTLIEGDQVRDHALESGRAIVTPYDANGLVDIRGRRNLGKYFWPFRTSLGARVTFGLATYKQEGRPWWEWHQVSVSRLSYVRAITFAEVSTHNHFVLDRGGKVFKQTAPVIKLPKGASEAEHLGLLGLLNSSVACFWLKQVCHNKGEGGGTRVEAGNSALGDEAWKSHFAFNSTKVSDFPLVETRPSQIATALDAEAQMLALVQPSAIASHAVPSRDALSDAKKRADASRSTMIALQEELDWHCYRLYDLTQADAHLEHPHPPPLELGQRAFEIVLARRVAADTEETSWFTRHGSTPITELPAHWPADYRAVVERRIALIESDRQIGLIERPEYKRRWNSEPWAEAERRALREWLLDRLESERHWAPRTTTSGGGGAATSERAPQLRSMAQLADQVRGDADFMQVATLYTGDDAFDVTRLVGELVAAESVPYLPALRYTEDGLRKRAAWEQTWALQREEDARGVALDIPVPPKYTKADFQGGDAWRLRGALDVPKERFVSYPGATPDGDGTLLVGWAGWTHLQQATALAAQYLALKEQEAWPAERLVPLLAGLAELVPWLRHWHNDLDPQHDARMGDYFAGFVQDEARARGVAEAALAAWRPSATGRGRPRGRGVRRAAATESSSP